MKNGKAARLNIRVAAELKSQVEDAALCEGQAVSDFAIAALARAAHESIQRHTKAKRMSWVIRVLPTGLTYWRIHEEREDRLPWHKERSRKK